MNFSELAEVESNLAKYGLGRTCVVRYRNAASSTSDLARKGCSKHVMPLDHNLIIYTNADLTMKTNVH